MQMAERICKIFKYLKGENMEKAVINEILQMVADLNAESYRQGKEWQWYSVYVPVYEKCPIIGFPYVILVRGESVRLSTEEEAVGYLEYEAATQIKK